MSPRAGVTIARRAIAVVTLVVGAGLACTEGVLEPITVGSVTVTGGPSTVRLGQQVQLNAALKSTQGFDLPTTGVTWTSSDASVVTVSAAGQVVALKRGSATISATAFGASGTLPFSVLGVESLQIAPDSLSLIVATEQTVAATIKADAGVTVPPTWESRDSTVVAVDASGKLRARRLGTAFVVASAEVARDSVRVRVLPVPVTPPPAGSTTPVTTTALSGAVTMTIPPGATTAPALTVAPAPTPPADDRVPGTMAYVFGPAGTQFATPIELALRFDPTIVPVRKRPFLRVNLIEGTKVTEVPGSRVDLAGGSVIASVSHFSTYGILVPTDPTAVSVTDGGGQATFAGYEVPVSPTVVVRDAQGRPVARARVRFEITAGGGTYRGSTFSSTIDTASTSADGTARLPGQWRLGPSAGQNTITVTAFKIGVDSVSATGTIVATAEANPVNRVEVSPASDTVKVGATRQLTAKLFDARDTVLSGRTVTWASSDPTRATVSSTGLVSVPSTVLSGGSVTVTATVEGKAGTATIIIPPPVSSVSVTPFSATVGIGSTQQLTASPKDMMGTTLDRPVTWSSSDTTKAKVSATGLVTAVALGTVTITATSEGRSGTASITVVEPVASVVMTPTTASLLPGGSQLLRAELRNANGFAVTGRQVTWSSSDPTKVTLTPFLGDGSQVTAQVSATVTEGASVTVTATSEGKSATATITILAPVASVAVTPATATVFAGGTQQLELVLKDAAGNLLTTAGRTISWTSSNFQATVSSTGLVTISSTATSGFTATITATVSESGTSAGTPATTPSGKSGTATITVPTPVSSVSVSPISATLAVGETQQLTATLRDMMSNTLTGRTVTWSSSDTTKATVSATGLVTAVAIGSATITASSEGRTATASIVVQEKVATIEVSPTTATIEAGGTQVFTATLKDAAGNVLPVTAMRWVTWTSSDPTRVTIDAPTPGSVSTTTVRVSSSLTTGATVTVTATVAGTSGPTGTATITVPTPVTSISVTPLSATVGVGSTQQLTAVPRDVAGTTLDRPVTWSSSNVAVATVSSTGLVTAVAIGSATITATSGGRTASASITVVEPVASVTMNPATTSLLPGASQELSVTLVDSKGFTVTGRAVSWSSSDPSRVSLTTFGADQQRVTAQVSTTASTATPVTITASVDGKQATSTITILAPVASISVEPSSTTLYNGETKQFVAVLKDAANNILSGRTVRWQTSNSMRAPISSDGLVTVSTAELSAATVTIDAFHDQTIGAGTGGTTTFKGTATISIPIPVSRVEIQAPRSAVSVGQVLQLSATTYDGSNNVLTGRTVTWSSSNQGIAKVSSTGLIEGIGLGTSTITATREGKSTQFTVTVQTPVATVTVSAPSATLRVNTEQSLSVVLRDVSTNILSSTNRLIEWSSSDQNIATVSSNGRMTALKEGTVTITATSDGQSGSTTVTVIASAFVRAANGVTITCGPATVGETGVVDGVTYTKRSRADLQGLVSTGNFSALTTSCTSGVTSMNAMFINQSTFNADISTWDVSAVSDMQGMFYNAPQFNQPIGAWDVSAVTTMKDMFGLASAFNQDISGWNTGNVTDMLLMFYRASAFNKPIGVWNVAKVTTMGGMFQEAIAFNQPIGAWNVSKVRVMNKMFQQATSFNQNIASWDVRNVNISPDMQEMFRDATSFNQNLSGWCVPNLSVEPSNFRTGAAAWLLGKPLWGTCPGG